MRKTVKRKCSVLLTLTLLLNCGAFLGVRAETSGETKEPQETAEEVVSLKTGRFLMIFWKVNREEKHEIQIVYNMDDAPFVLRYG